MKKKEEKGGFLLCFVVMMITIVVVVVCSHFLVILLLVNTVSIELRFSGLRMHVFESKLMHAHGLQVRMMCVGHGRVHLMHRHCIHRGHFVFLLPLHSSVLEPDFDLPLC